MGRRIDREDFFSIDAERLAVELLGKVLVRRIDGEEYRYIIAETECYMGVEDTACHAARKKPISAKTLWARGGKLYIYLIYGLHYMVNIVAGTEGDPMCVLIRGVKDTEGPARVTKLCKIDKTLNGEDLLTSDRIWLEDDGISPSYSTAPRVGIDYASKEDRERHWRFLAYDFL